MITLNLSWEHYQALFFVYGKGKCFSAVRSWLVEPEIGGHLGVAKTAL